jgi:hypothetical protein
MTAVENIVLASRRCCACSCSTSATIRSRWTGPSAVTRVRPDRNGPVRQRIAAGVLLALARLGVPSPRSSVPGTSS